MSVQVEKLENSMAKLTIEVSADELEKAIESAYQRQKRQISIPGFRKGKVPRKMVEKMYGVGIFYEDAANALMQNTYPSAVDECGEDIVSRPSIDIVQLEAGKPFIYTAEVAVRPEIKLGKYKGVEVTRANIEITDEDIDKAIEQEQKKNSRTVEVTDRAIEEGDVAVIDFEGFVDGEAFAGGKGENHPLKIGSHSFIDNFEDQLIGRKAGDETEVNVTFPEQYQAEELAGKDALFKVKIHKVETEELPELDDDFAQEISEFDTLDEYKADLREKLAKDKETEVRKNQEDEAIQAIIDDSEINLPEPMVDTQCDSMIDEFAQQLAQSGLSMDQYMQFSGMTIDKLKEQVRPEAETRIKSSLVLENVAEAENIQVSDEDIDAKIKEMAENYHIEAEKIKDNLGEAGRESLTKEISMSKAVDLIMENVTEVEREDKKERE